MNSIIPKVEILGGTIQLTKPSGYQIRAAAKAFRALFGVRPVIRVKGSFGPQATRAGAALNLTNGTHPVHNVGTVYLTVKPGPGLETADVIPEKGVNVTIFLSVP